MTIQQQKEQLNNHQEHNNVILDETNNQYSKSTTSNNTVNTTSHFNKSNLNTQKKLSMPLYQQQQNQKEKMFNNSNNMNTTKSKIPVFRYNSPNNKSNINNNSNKLITSNNNNAQNELPMSNNKYQQHQQQTIKQQVISNGSYHAFRSNSRNTNNSRQQDNDYLLLQQRHTNNNNNIYNKKSDSPIQMFTKNHSNTNNMIKPNKIQFQNNKLNSFDHQSSNNKPQLISNMNYLNANGKILVSKNNNKKLIRRSKSISDEKLENLDNNNNTNQNGNNNNNISSTYSSASSLYSSSSSSCLSIINLIEETQNIYDFIHLIKKNLKKIEQSYSIDELYLYLKDNVKYNGYRNFTIDFLQTYLQKYEPALSQLQMTNINSINTNNKKVKRSLTQIKHPSTNHNHSPYFLLSKHISKYDLNGRTITNKNLKAIEKFLNHLNLIRQLFNLVRRDILLKILAIELPFNNYKNNSVESPDLLRPASRSLKNLSQLNQQQQIGSISTNNINSNNNNRKQNKDSSLLIHLRKCQIKLYDLNEKLEVLLNDASNCDTKLLSSNSQLPLKFEHFKHGEFILRLTNDLIIKIRLILILSERFFNLNFKLNGNISYFQSPNTNLSITKKEADLINAMSKLNNHINNIEDELEDDFLDLDNFDSDNNNYDDEHSSCSVLKTITRVKHQQKLAHQKLPKINQKQTNQNNNVESNSKNKDDNNEYYYRPINKEELNNNNNLNKGTLATTAALTNLANTNSNSTSTNPTTNNLMLVKQDTNDSFIQDTDCSSILSEDDSVVYYSTNEFNLLKQKLQIPPQQNKNNDSVQNNYTQPLNREKLIEEYKLTKLQIETTNQSINDLDIYLQGLINRAERCIKLEEQLKSDQELIRKTKSSLKLYNSSDVENKKVLKANSNEHEAFKIQLQKQLGYLQYRFGLTLQDYKNEQMYYAQIEQSINDTQIKLNNLNYKLDELNKYFMYIESLLNNPSNSIYPSQQLLNNKHNYNSKLYNYQHNKLENSKSDSKLSNNNYSTIPKALPPLQPSQTSFHPVSINSNINSNDYYK
jgi:hypothetical protein